MKKLIAVLLMAVMALTACATQTSNDATTPADKTSQATEAATTQGTSGEAMTTEAPVEALDLKVIMPYGTPTLSMIKMVVENPEIAEGVTVTYEPIQATDVLTASLINGEADIAIVPTNLAAVMHAKGAGYKLAGSSVWGVLYVASTEDINSLEDLKGKEISLIGRNLTPDAVFRYVLTENGINPDEDMTLNYFTGASELSANYISGESDHAMIPQPVLTAAMIKREGTKVVIDLQEEWSKLTGTQNFPQASIIVRETLIEERPEVVAAFLDQYAESVHWLNDNAQTAGEYYVSLNIGLAAPIIQKAIPFCNLYYQSAEEGKEALDGYLEVLNGFNPALTGGQPVDDSLYYLP